MIRGALTLAALLIALPATAQSLIVRSVGPSKTRYPVGTRLADDSKLVLVDGDLIVLMDRSGTRQITKEHPVSLWTRREPGRIAYAAGLSTEDSLCTFAGQCDGSTDGGPAGQPATRGFRITRGGPAVAGGRKTESAAAIAFALPVSDAEPGGWCVSDERAVRMLGRSTASPGFAAKRLPGNAKVAFSPAEVGRVWSHDLPAGRSAVLVLPTGRFTFHAIPEAVWRSPNVDQAEAFIKAGCRRSLEQLVAQQDRLGAWTLPGTAKK